ncbi:hypothetical protein EV128_103247 [Rhizobium azibense]|nr:hypothetical protein EV128_103247 [Rhizobium azibense]
MKRTPKCQNIEKFGGLAPNNQAWRFQTFARDAATLGLK